MVRISLLTLISCWNFIFICFYIIFLLFSWLFDLDSLHFLIHIVKQVFTDSALLDFFLSFVFVLLEKQRNSFVLRIINFSSVCSVEYIKELLILYIGRKRKKERIYVDFGCCSRCLNRFIDRVIEFKALLAFIFCNFVSQ